MRTPSGVTPLAVAPPSLSDRTLAFAFAGTKLLIGGSAEAPGVPTLTGLERAGTAVVRRSLGRLEGVDCMAIVLGDDAVAPAGFTLIGLRALFPRMPDVTL